MWRWSWRDAKVAIPNEVFSTYVEVIPMDAEKKKELDSFLHVCGGDPSNASGVAIKMLFSPRMWRWSHGRENVIAVGFVFSTYVEVILRQPSGSFLT